MEEIHKKLGGDLKFDCYLYIEYFGAIYPVTEKGIIVCDCYQFCVGKRDDEAEFAEFTICDPNVIDNVCNFVTSKMILLSEKDKKRISKVYDIIKKAKAIIDKSCKKALP